MTRLPALASVLQAAGRFASKNCPSSMPTTSVSSWTWRINSSEFFTFSDAIRMSLCDTMWSSLKRSSRSGLKIWTFWRAIWARRRRRISSSLLPLNMLPALTSIQPWWGCFRTTSMSGPRLVLPGLGADADLVAFVDKRRHLHDETGFERRRLHLRAGSCPFDPGDGFLDDEIDGRRQLDPDRLALVELDADRRIGNQVVLRIAECFMRDVDLFVGRRIHEIKVVGVVIEVLHLALVEHRAFDVLFGAELVVGQGERPDVPHAALDVRALFARRQMMHVEESEQVVANLDEHAFPKPRCLYR